VTVLNTLLSEDVQAFTQWRTGRMIGGKPSGVGSIAVVNDKLHLLVNRLIDGQVVYHIERESNDFNTDAAVKRTFVSETITGLQHLEGETVQVKADGSYMGEFVVTGGEVTINRSANSVEVGLGLHAVN
jgi:hypothetical protein